MYAFVIDKIELRLPVAADFRRPIREQIRWPGSIRSGLHYAGVMDLRPHGMDALLHYHKERGPHTHKLELLDTGDKSYSDMAALIDDVTDYDANRLELMRIDLCADVPDVPVAWFHAHARFRYKQMERCIGDLKSDVICLTRMETISAGRRPNILRIYDKVAEWRMHFRKRQRRQSRDAAPLDFAQEYGVNPQATLTRIERQYGGGRLPGTLQTFGNIARAVDMDPFDTLELNEKATYVPPPVEDYDLGEWLKGMRLHDELQARGMHNFHRWLNYHSRGNAARIMRRYATFFPASNGSGVTKTEIVRLYRESTVRQPAA